MNPGRFNCKPSSPSLRSLDPVNRRILEASTANHALLLYNVCPLAIDENRCPKNTTNHHARVHSPKLNNEIGCFKSTSLLRGAPQPNSTPTRLDQTSTNLHRRDHREQGLHPDLLSSFHFFRSRSSTCASRRNQTSARRSSTVYLQLRIKKKPNN